jgi:hypothetical protein
MPDSGTTLVNIARAALLEITTEATIGDFAGQVEEAGATTLAFAAAMPGYPGWNWTVSVAVLEGGEPSVLEVELMPGEGALLAPDWVPWSERLADYEAAQEAQTIDETDDDLEGSELEDDADTDDEDDEDDAEDDEDDDLGSDVLHAGDLDGVDIDDLDDSPEDDEDDDDVDADDEDEDRTY